MFFLFASCKLPEIRKFRKRIQGRRATRHFKGERSQNLLRRSAIIASKFACSLQLLFIAIITIAFCLELKNNNFHYCVHINQISRTCKHK